MRKTQNRFCATHSNQITLTQLIHINTPFKIKKCDDDFFYNECRILLLLCPYVFLIIGIWCSLDLVSSCFPIPSLDQICEVRNFEVYRHWLIFTKVEIFEMFKSIKSASVNLSSVKIHGFKLFNQYFHGNTGLNISKFC